MFTMCPNFVGPMKFLWMQFLFKIKVCLHVHTYRFRVKVWLSWIKVKVHHEGDTRSYNMGYFEGYQQVYYVKGEV